MKRLLCFLSVILIAIPVLRSQEFLLHDETFTWTENADQCGGFHYWYDYGNSPSMNWTSPFDYQNGFFYFRFEIINQPSNEPFKLNFCIWADFSSGPPVTWKESCGTFSDILAGPGSVSTVSSHVSPAYNGGIDWTNLLKLWRFGNPLWVDGYNMGPSIYCTDHPEVWAKKDLYFPLTLRVTIVAVAAGYTFSGWDSYLGGCSKPAQPGAISGNTNPAEGSSQTYSVADVSGATSYTWTLPSGWSGSSATSSINATVGSNGGTISVTANNSCGSGAARSLSVSVGCDNPIPQPIPAYGINYGGEVTNKIVPATDEYSYNSNMSNTVNGNSQVLQLTPGQDVYFRTKASSNGCYTASEVQHLIVPPRPAMPAFSIDYIHETTSENVGTSIYYTPNSNYANPVSGTGEKVALTPGQDLYLWVKPTASSFASVDYHLIIPERPATPSFAVDFANEMSNEAVTSAYEYATQSDMGSAITGNNNKLAIDPGTTLYFRKKATASAFKSDIQTLIIPERPASPSYTVSYSNEHTAENVPSTVDYSTSSNMSGALAGTGTALALIPGTDYYFRMKHTSSSFVSGIFHLAVNERPTITIAAGDTVHDAFNASVDFHEAVTGFKASDMAVTNAQVTLTGALTVHVDPVSTGDVTVKVVANAVTAGNFASDVFKTYYKVVTSVPDGIGFEGSLSVFPSPVGDLLHIEIKKGFALPVEVKLMNSNGAVVIHQKLFEAAGKLDMRNLHPGLYILKAVDAEGKVISGKIIKQ